MQKRYYPYGEFREDLKALIEKIDEDFDVLMPISRGGLSMGQMLGEFYGIREVYAVNTISYDETKKRESVTVFNLPTLKEGQRVLILDDIVDSGDTLVELLKVLKINYPTIIFKTATIFYKPTAIIEPNWWVKNPEAWIEFFWSEDLKS